MRSPSIDRSTSSGGYHFRKLLAGDLGEVGLERQDGSHALGALRGSLIGVRVFEPMSS